MRLMLALLTDGGTWKWLSVGLVKTPDAVLLVTSPGCDVVVVELVSVRCREDIDALELRLSGPDLLVGDSTWSAVPSPAAGFEEPPTPTASLNLLYSPLKPCCTNSPADPL